MNCTTFSKGKRYHIVLLVLLSLFITNLYGQSPVTVKGKVTGQLGEPLSGVSIVVKGSTASALSGNDGAFELQAPLNSTLAFSFVGHLTKEIKVTANNAANLAVELSANRNDLDQVVVVGYGTRRKSDVTGSIVSVTEQAIKDIPAANLAQALQGQGAG